MKFFPHIFPHIFPQEMFLGFQDYIHSIRVCSMIVASSLISHAFSRSQATDHFCRRPKRLIGKMLYQTSRLEYECWRCSFTVAGRRNLLKSVSFGFAPRPSLVYRVGHHDGLLTTDQPVVQHGSGSTILPHWAQLVFFGTTSCPVVRNST